MSSRLPPVEVGFSFPCPHTLCLGYDAKARLFMVMRYKQTAPLSGVLLRCVAVPGKPYQEVCYYVAVRCSDAPVMHRNSGTQDKGQSVEISLRIDVRR
jgi:hypothetical protein